MIGIEASYADRAGPPTGVGPALLQWLTLRRDAMVAHLADLVRHETPSQEPERLKPAFAGVAEQLRGLLFEVRVRPGRRAGGFLLARPAGLRRRAPIQLVLGHLDTVWPAGTLRRMPCVVEDGWVRGPGAYDAKGGVTQLVFALRALAAHSLTPQVAPVVLLGGDEEIGSPDSTPTVERLARRADRALVLEPSLGPGGRLKTARKGVGRFTVTVHGKAAHAGLDPDAGASAILELSHVVQALFGLNDPARGVTVNVGQVDGGIGANVVAAVATAAVDVRVPTAREGAHVAEALRALRAVTPGTRVVVEGAFGRPPLVPTPTGRALWERARAHGRALGLDLAEGRAGGGSDGCTAGRWTATLDGLGPVGGGAHAAHERVAADALPARAALLALLLLDSPLERGAR